ncbi:anticodon-binding protein [Endogone sp. FLAS-F59071]|nr:anticodon-binding protein [Endogone sp. FLAS-F59071]|eukprot:RUS21632.1 anticodon-binding protein [Endogone sp. FLAS-F59071]
MSATAIKVNPVSIKNKIKREDIHHRVKVEKAKAKRVRRQQLKKEEEEDPEKKEERLKKNVPKTLENTREFDETIVQEDNEVAEDEATDEFAKYFGGQAPKILITTSKCPSATSYDFAAELLSIFPNAEFVKRTAQFEIKQIVQFCKNREFTDIVIVNEDKKQPNAITMIHLPDGPTAYFKLSSITLSKDIQGHGRTSSHKPELILNNFNTRLGHTVGRMFTALFPHVPEFQGRQVCTFHNQRDFIFFRRHRYVFKDTNKVGLQELGPKFTLKLKWLQKGTLDRQGEYEWVFKPEMETSRRRFFL